MAISSSVGYQSVNKKDDVITVQKLLNQFLITQSCSLGGSAGAELAASFFSGGEAIPPIAPLTPDGGCGPKTIAAIVWFQKNIHDEEKPSGVVRPDGVTWFGLNTPLSRAVMGELVADSISLPKTGSGSVLTDTDFENAAKDLGVEVAAIKAVGQVETRGNGFTDDGRPVIRFEAHKFGKSTQYFYNRPFPDISVVAQNNSLVQGGAAGMRREYNRLGKAMVLDRARALEATSWGRFQILGENWSMMKLSSVEQFIEEAFISEQNQLDHFCAFVKGKNLIGALQKHDWLAVARGYNGKNQVGYDAAIEAAFNKLTAKTKTTPPARI